MAKKSRTPKTGGLKKLKITKTNTEECGKACLILKHSHESSQALLRAYKLARGIRSLLKSGILKPDSRITTYKTMPGMSTDEEQDLLRSMLVTAASGLDAMLKQLIRDALLPLTKTVANARFELEKFVQRRLKSEIEEKSFEGAKFLARALVAPSIQQQIVEDYMAHLTAGSLQSSDELAKIVAALGLSKEDVVVDHKALRPIFEIRNKIIHELDINLDAERRNRNVRNEPTMKKHTNKLLSIAESILESVDNKLKKAI